MLQSKIRVGELDREISFIQAIIEQGDSGEDKITGWELIDDEPSLNAKRVDESGTTVVANDRVTWTQTVNWIIRHRTDLNVRMRLVYETQVFEILNILPHEGSRGRFLRIVTSLVDNEFFT